MFRLNEQTKLNIEKKVGLTVSAISRKPILELDKHIERKIGKNLDYQLYKEELNLIGRGSVYFPLDRILYIQDVDEELSKV